MALLQFLFVFFGERSQACQWQGGVEVRRVSPEGVCFQCSTPLPGADQDPGGWPKLMRCQVLGGQLSRLAELLIARLCGPDVGPALFDVCRWVLL